MKLPRSTLKEAQLFVQSLLGYLNKAGSPFHSVRQLVKYISDSRLPFTHLKESETWNLGAGKNYCVVSSDGTMMVFHVGKNFDPKIGGLILVACHTDSPCLKLELNCNSNSNGLNQINVCTYGGGLWHTWLDRDLGVAGKVLISRDGNSEEYLLHVRRPLIFIPNLAIHLQNAQEREAFKLNKEKNLKGVISTQMVHQMNSRNAAPLLELLAKKAKCNVTDIVDIDLCLMETSSATISGVYGEFLTGGRLDNLVSCFSSVAAFTESLSGSGSEFSSDSVFGVICYNYEEIGSNLAYGANSQITEDWLKRILDSLGCSLMKTRSRAFLLSLDMAHGVHPNYPEKHIPSHMPSLHGGVVIKRNVNGRYATNLRASSVVKEAAKYANVPLQEFRVGNETPCGSTVGPYLSSRLCIPVADVGIPQLGMHSIREICSVVDVWYLCKLVKGLFSKPAILNNYVSCKNSIMQ